MKGGKKYILVLAALFLLISAAPAYAEGAWREDKFGRWYQNQDGSYPASAWRQIDGAWYYFKESGYCATGPLIIEEEQYYFDSLGRMASKQWIEFRGNWYYFSEDGPMVRKSWIDDIYYVDSDGVMAKGKWVDGIYIDSDGEAEHSADNFFD